MIVPNVFPSIPDPSGRRLAIVGDCPSRDDAQIGDPFIGSAGKLLRLVLGSSGINTQSCFLGNICQHFPPNGDLESLDWQGAEIQQGLATLEADLARFNPHCILALGRGPFRYFKPDKCYQGRPSKENPSGYAIPLQNWRGSIFADHYGRKIVACFHPSYVLKAFSDLPYFRNDVSRAVRHADRKNLPSLVRLGVLRPTISEVLTFLQDITDRRVPASFDIEGYSDAVGVTMLSICPTPTSGIVIPFWLDGTHYWQEEEEAQVWKALSTWLASPTCPKKGHNLFYETLVLGWRHHCVVDGLISDTMMKHWEFYNELEKSLAVATSMWTEEPYYKDDRGSSNSDTKLLYNFKDSACTEEVDLAIEPHLRKHPEAYAHFEFNVSLIPAFTYMHLRGCKFDHSRAAAHKKAFEAELVDLITQIDQTTLPILGHPFNPKSTKDKQWLLYEHLAHKPYTRYGQTTKEEVMLRYYNKRKDKVLLQVIRAVRLRTRISDLEKLAPSADGRLRTAYNLVATDTGRSNSSETSIAEALVSPKGKIIHRFDGTNLQNVASLLRDVCITDGDDFTFFQADLKGADAWTVAADLAALGHSHMLEDLKAGVQPAKLLLRMLEVLDRGGDPSIIARLSSADAKAECDKVEISDAILPDGRAGNWFYTSLKRVQHGTNYEGQAPTISALIFKDSDGVIDIQPTDIEKYQRLYRLRYNVGARTTWLASHLAASGGILQCACGIRRRVFGVRNPRAIDNDILRQMLASEPQANTTFATNNAIKNLWNDPSNRRKNGALFIEPLLQVHDAVAGQFPSRLQAFAKIKLQEWFTTELTIHGIKITIPVDIKIGRNWGTCKQPI